MMIHGTITKTLPDGTENEAHYIVDTDKNEFVRVGGEADITDDDINEVMSILSPGGLFGADGGEEQ